jgi:hypothetical protein
MSDEAERKHLARIRFLEFADSKSFHLADVKKKHILIAMQLLRNIIVYTRRVRPTASV